MLVVLFLIFSVKCLKKTNGSWEPSQHTPCVQMTTLFLSLCVKPLQNGHFWSEVFCINKPKHFHCDIACFLSNTKLFTKRNVRGRLQVRGPLIFTPVNISFCRRLSFKSRSYKPHILAEFRVKKQLSEVSQVCQREDLDYESEDKALSAT